MASRKLPNYLLLHRRRLGLSQKEVAFLLGKHNSCQPSRYEHFSRKPTLSTALALAVIFQASVSELFLGEYEKAANAVCRQAERLKSRLLTQSPGERATRKLAGLKMILSPDNKRS